LQFGKMHVAIFLRWGIFLLALGVMTGEGSD
jgi:hypothetical protein